MDELKKREWLCLLIGTALLAVGVEGFFAHADLVAGGVTGIGILLNDFTTGRLGMEIPLWFVNLALNLPLFLIAWKLRGRRFVGRTVLASVVFSVMLYVQEIFPIYSTDPLLAAVFGGAAAGVGLGLVLSAGATTGGVDLAATLLHLKWERITVSHFIFALDASVILAGMAVFGVEKSLYAILAVFVTEKCIVWVVEGAELARGAWIFSEKKEEIRKALLRELRNEAVVFSSRGMQGEQKGVFCVFSQKEMQTVKRIIINIDRNAVLFVSDVRQVLGEGFQKK